MLRFFLGGIRESRLPLFADAEQVLRATNIKPAVGDRWGSDDALAELVGRQKLEGRGRGENVDRVSDGSVDLAVDQYRRGVHGGVPEALPGPDLFTGCDVVAVGETVIGHAVEAIV